METSALVKRYRSENGTEVVTELVDQRTPDDSFVTSYFSVLEVEATIARALKARLVDQRGYNRLLGQFSMEVDDIIMLQPINNNTILKAISMARRHSLRSGDAVHLATASLIRQSIDDVPSLVLVTGDGELASAAVVEGFQVLDLRQPDVAMSLLKSWRE